MSSVSKTDTSARQPATTPRQVKLNDKWTDTHWCSELHWDCMILSNLINNNSLKYIDLFIFLNNDLGHCGSDYLCV